ncbi:MULTISPECIES: hypothetical protein [unclassified Caulobacter]|uniref:hypothetical protein n=1 Tax=unclassified Caulobacter TaxID=2648921 RepID=UPI0007803B43|nr:MULTISPECIES: hypothetical protein [unclassified Caulobacter]AZS22489.1 hypothetical protein CSW63_18750 [Caulobacter sp. FWC26]
MATTAQVLKIYYGNILRTDAAHIPAAHQTLLTNLSSQIDSGALSVADARTQIAKLALETTTVASMAYSFFTPGVPGAGGFDYLVSPTGPNTTNLNSDYYKTFNVENRFINFAMNLGKAGEGAAWFNANYGALSTRDSLIKAYTEIFGVVPSQTKVDGLLGDMVPDGQGGTFTRQAYFAAFARDGLEGQGTKAAIVGWLLSVAAKENIGPYATANNAFLADLGDDGVAQFRSDLLVAYGSPPAPGTAGVTLTVAGDKSVSPTASDAGLKSSANNDTITVTGDIAGGVTIDAGAGRDTIKVTLGTFGAIRTSDGGDTLTLGHLLATTPTLGVPAQYGTVTLAGDSNVVTLKGSMAKGTSLTATGTANVLHIDRTGATDSTFYDGEISGFQTVYYHSTGPAPLVQGAAVFYSVVDNPADKGRVNFNLGGGQIAVLKDTPNGAYVGTTGLANGAATAHLHLQNFKGAATTEAYESFGAYKVDGGAIGFSVNGADATKMNGTMVLHVDADSTAGLIYGWSTNAQVWQLEYALSNLTILGPGKLTAQIDGNFTNVDATLAGDLNLTYLVGKSTSGLVDDSAAASTLRLGDGTNNLKLVFAAATSSSAIDASKFYLGAGVDTISLGASLFSQITTGSLSNLVIKGAAGAEAIGAPAEIIGFTKGVDHLVLDAVIHTLSANVQQYADGKATLQAAVIDVSAHTTANTAAIFTCNGDTYVYSQDSLVGVNMRGGSNLGDGLIKLVGVTGLTVGTGAGSYDIHYG